MAATVKTFRGTLSKKQTFAIGADSYRADAHGCFTTDEPEVIAFLAASPFWEVIAFFAPSPFWEELSQVPTPEPEPETQAAAKKAKG